MRKISFTLNFLSILGFAMSSIAQGDLVKVSVNGMVCGFCAQGITKKLNNTGAVEKVKVDLENKVVSFSTLKDKVFDDSAITKLITEAGYNVVKIERGKE